MNISVKDLLDAGVHFGHQRKRWNPRSKDFVFDHRYGVSIIDLEKTYNKLEEACKVLEDLAASDKKILMIGTKRQAQDMVRETALACQMPFSANRWLGGTLTNFETIKRSIAKYKKYIAMENDGSLAKLPGKEGAMIKREMARMHRNFEGLLEMGDLPAALFIVDIKHEAIAVEEAKRLKIPVIALVDTNSDPSKVDHPIPGNDDAAKSLRIILDTVGEAIQAGVAQRESRRASKNLGAASRSDVNREAAKQFTSDEDDVRIDGESLSDSVAAPAPAAQPEAAPAEPAKPEPAEPAKPEPAEPEASEAPKAEPEAAEPADKETSEQPAPAADESAKPEGESEEPADKKE